MLRTENLTYRIAGREILAGATVHVPAGHKVGVVGRNGAGKTTLLRLIAGELQADGGGIAVRNGARIGLLQQEAPDGPDSLIDTVLAADAERHRLLAEAEAASAPERIAEVHQRLADIGAHTAPARAARILAGLGFDEPAQARPLDSFSGGWRMRVALAAMLFLEPDLLLLDEPTNYLDLEGAMWLESFLATYPRTLMIVSHDRDFLNKVAGSILHVDGGKLKLFRGNYDSFERTRRERLALQEKMRLNQDVQRKHMQAFVDRFRYKASKARQAQSRLKALAKMTPIAAVMEERSASISFPEPQALPPPIVSMDGVSVGYAAGVPVLSRLNLRIDMDDRIALLGRNGNGKTTFARLLAGELRPMGGRVHRAGKLKVGHFAQHQIDALDPDATAYRHMAALLPGKAPAEVRARLGAFGFSQALADVAASDLSGGEKARLVLALISVEAPGLLVLDEPSNHLDVDTREVLVQALNDFDGGIVLISHDRHLVELIADRLWLVAGNTVRPFEGDLDDYRRLVLGEGRRVDAEGERRPVDRKQDRRISAEARQQLAPLRRQAREAEQAVERLNAERAAVDAALARPPSAAAGAERLVALNRRRAEIERRLADAEAAWLDAMAALEEAQPA
jgi:ATP-binding cassette subfamily F protein 3